MRLVPDLEARFLRREVRVERRCYMKPTALVDRPTGPFTDDDIEEREGEAVYLHTVDQIADADGVWFLCPKCYAANGGPMGTHAVLCWFVGRVPDDAEPKPGRWTPSGTGLGDLTFVPSEGRTPSVALLAGCSWHGHVKHGDAT